jgi:hypothetical protein
MGLVSGNAAAARRKGVIVPLATAQVVAFAPADIDRIITKYLPRLMPSDIDRLLDARLALADRAALIPYDCGICAPRGSTQCATCPVAR